MSSYSHLSRFKAPLVIVSFASILILLFEVGKHYEWTGFGKDETISTTVEKNPQGNIIRTVTTTTPQSGKTLWDILSLIGVPTSLALLGWWLQVQQQYQSDVNLREEALKEYIDTIADLLIEKNLIAIATKVRAEENKLKEQSTRNSTVAESETEVDGPQSDSVSQSVATESSPSVDKEHLQGRITDEQRELLNAAKDIITARTLSILRRLGDDIERKAAVILFLAESDVIERVSPDLSGVDLRGVQLKRANLKGICLMNANLDGSNFEQADLSGANLFNANLNKAQLSANLANANLSTASLADAYLSTATLNNANLMGANLRRANLRHANLMEANLRYANLIGANLHNAKLHNAIFTDVILANADLGRVEGSTEEQISNAFLCHTWLPKEYTLNSDRDCEKLASGNVNIGRRRAPIE